MSKIEEEWIEECFVIKTKENIFQDHIHVIFTDDINKSIKYQCKQKGIGWKKLTAGPVPAGCVCHIDKKKYKSTWVHFDVRQFNHGIALHESVHVVFKMLNSRGLRHTSQTDEAYAYATQFVFNKIMGFYAKLPAKVKKMKIKM